MRIRPSPRVGVMGRAIQLIGVIVLLLCSSSVHADPLRVRLLEGNSRGFVVLRSLHGEAIAYGESWQKMVGTVIESHLILRFKDGSHWEETTTFSQKGVFRLEAQRLVQRGPSLPAMEVAFDRRTGRYTARSQEKKDAKEESAGGPLAMPADLYNGMAVVLLKNLAAGTSITVQTVVFTPQPRFLKTTLAPEGEDRVDVGEEAKKATRYLVKLEIGGLTGTIASLIGKEPPDLRYWLVSGDVPAFVRFEGAMFLNGPVWRLELTTVQWPK
jgi:hypothetical protein